MCPKPRDRQTAGWRAIGGSRHFMPAKSAKPTIEALTSTNRQPGGRSGDRVAGLRPLIPRGGVKSLSIIQCGRAGFHPANRGVGYAGMKSRPTPPILAQTPRYAARPHPRLQATANVYTPPGSPALSSATPRRSAGSGAGCSRRRFRRSAPKTAL